MFLRPIHFIPSDTKIDFVAKRWWAFSVTILLVLVTIGSLAIKGLNLGIDFKGGILIEAKAPQAVNTAELRTELQTLNLGEIELQQFGAPTDILIRIQRQEGDETAQMAAVQSVREKLGTNYEYRRVEVVGPALWQLFWPCLRFHFMWACALSGNSALRL
jgi:preprotein translocase subunit SecF